MKAIFKLMLTLILFSSISLFAQANKNYDGPRPEVYQGSKSFVFMYTPFQTNLEPVFVGTISIPDGALYDASLYGAGFQYYVTPQIALVFGLSLGTSSSKLEDDAGSTESTVTIFGISVDANYHFNSLYSVSPYIGFHLNYGLLSGSVEVDPDGGETSTTEYSGNGFGVAAQLGFDWYFTGGLSLGGKYALGFQSLGTPEVTTEDGTEEGPSTTAFGISTFSVMLNVHF